MGRHPGRAPRRDECEDQSDAGKDRTPLFGEEAGAALSIGKRSQLRN